MKWFAIQRITDGKFLLRQTRKGKCPMTWMSFDEGHSPYLYESYSAAASALKLWRRGGWIRGRSGGITVREQQDRLTMQVHVVAVEMTVVDDASIPEPADKVRNPNSVLY